MKALALFLLLASQVHSAADSVLAIYFNRRCADEASLTDCSGNGYTQGGAQAPTYTGPIAEGSYSAAGFVGCCTSDNGNGLHTQFTNASIRSEERRVGKECR